MHHKTGSQKKQNPPGIQLILTTHDGIWDPKAQQE